MSDVIASQGAAIAAIGILYIGVVFAIGKLIGEPNKEDEIEIDGWYSKHMKPVHVGRYRVRFPQSKHEVLADWDGSVWRDTTNGHECYFQLVEWKAT